MGDEMEKVIPTIVRTVGSELWFSWNARKRQQWCWQRFKTDRRRASDIVISKTFEDNPWMFPRCESVTCQTPSPWDTADQPCEVCGGPKWPGVPDFMAEVRAMQKDEPERYAHVYGGQPDDGDAARQVLTYAMVKACVEAFRLGLAPKRDGLTPQDAGLDLRRVGRTVAAKWCAAVLSSNTLTCSPALRATFRMLPSARMTAPWKLAIT